MDRERLKRIEELFQEALDLAPGQRSAFLEESCGEDAELRREVEAFVAAHAEAGDLMDRPIVEHGIPPGHDSSAAPEYVGPYRVLRKIGEGGMSEVYLAIRDDVEFRKRVAAKLIRHDMDSEDLLRRFRTERQILAGLDHPNIAKLLDGGSTESGLPYFVMDYIDGVPIDRYCDAQRLSINERLELFRTVCSAVQYAHQNLVIHRDIKASNILVTSEGVPKLLDFGIAKLLNPEQFALQVEYTATWLRPMTPSYASPEQIGGKMVGTPSDVYSLGVLLYKLLTGHLPYQLHGLNPTDVTRVILEHEPDKPSTAVGRTDPAPAQGGAPSTAITPELVSRARGVQAPQLRRQLAGDLDNIVMMALRKEAQRRYSSVEQLSEDIRRYLAGMPVLARTDTLGYRAAKFLRRNRLGVAVAAAFVVLLVGFAFSVTLQRDEARRERDRAEQVVAFMKDIFESSDPFGPSGEAVTALEILDRGAERIELELRDQPEVQATLAESIGSVYRSLGLYDRAQPLLERSLEIRLDTLGEEHLAVAQSKDTLGYVLYDRGEYDEAERLLREALEIRRRQLDDDDPVIAGNLGRLGLLLKYRGDVESAEKLYREALAIYRAVDYKPEQANVLNSLAALFVDRSDLAGSEAMFREALALRRELYGAGHPKVGETLNNLGVVLGMQGKVEESERALREALTVRRSALGEDHHAVGDTLNNLARLLHLGGELDAAEPMYLEALEIKSATLGDDHPQVAKMRNNVAGLLQERGDYAAAESLAREALESRRATLGDGHPETSRSMIRLGSILVDAGRPAEAEPVLREALQALEVAAPANHYSPPEARSHLGACLARMERFEQAEPLLVDGYEGLLETQGPGHRRTRAALERVIVFYEAWGRPQKAAEFRALVDN
jgi:serine/threonine-protein kinase